MGMDTKRDLEGAVCKMMEGDQAGLEPLGEKDQSQRPKCCVQERIMGL